MRSENYDVIVVGGGAAGTAAAIGAAQSGARTLLLERYGFLGGAATASSVLTFCGLYQVGDTAVPTVAGAASAVLDRLAQYGTDVAPFRARSGNWIVAFHPEMLKLALDDALEAAGVETRLHATLIAATCDGARTTSIEIADHAGRHHVSARAFVDASGDAALAAALGLPMDVDATRGDHVQAASLPIRVGGIAASQTITREAFAAAARAVNRDLDDTDGPHLRQDGGVFIRVPGADEVWWTCVDIVTDGMSSAVLSRAERQGRRLAGLAVTALRAQPGFERAHIASTGPQIGLRETRRPHARLTLSAAYCGAGSRSAKDGIGRGAWPMEVHTAPGHPVFTSIGGAGFFDIPLNALRADGVDNLFLAGRVIGADAEAYGSIRVMGTGFATGHAAGIAAADIAAGGSADPAAVRTQLLLQDAII